MLFNKALLQEALHWDWQKVTSNTVNDIDTLAFLLDLDRNALAQITQPNAFKLRVPLPFVSRMQPQTMQDPLLLQILPLQQEHILAPGFCDDPLNENQYNVRPGLVHKYHARVLLTAATSCPINCRYCFRRHFPYDKNRLTPSSWQPALDYIAQDSSITEVILSGGEPLLLNDVLLSQLLDKIESIPHVTYLRIHTRYPIVVPQRLTPALCNRLMNARCSVAMVLHCNHPNEIDEHVEPHLRPLVNSSVTVMNQTVLLKDINNDVASLRNLCEKLYAIGVLPYYLHATDPVNGTTHFQVSDEQAKALTLELTHCLPGYMVPTLVREVSGEKAKTRLPLNP